MVLRGNDPLVALIDVDKKQTQFGFFKRVNKSSLGLILHCLTNKNVTEHINIHPLAPLCSLINHLPYLPVAAPRDLHLGLCLKYFLSNRSKSKDAKRTTDKKRTHNIRENTLLPQTD